MKQVVMCSLWRNDAGKRLRERALHLLSRTYPALRFVWVVGDSDDSTYDDLLAIRNEIGRNRRIDLLRHDTHIVGDDPPTRRRRLAETANAFLERVRSDDDYVLAHESDLLSPPDVVERMLATGLCPLGCWPLLVFPNNTALFYDIWAYRKDGQMFTNTPPFHPCYTPDASFELDSIGSVYLFDAADVRAGLRYDAMAVVGLCRQLRERGRHIWCDPRITVVQPSDLWICHSTAD